MNLNTFLTLIETISKLELEHLPKEWIELIWRQGFPTPIEVPSEYELQVNLDCTALLGEIRELLQRWIEEDMDVDTPGPSRESLASRKSWNGLANEINYKGLLCLLSAYVSSYNPRASEETEVNSNDRAVEAARLYLMLISVDGSHIFQVFQNVIFMQCLEIFKSLATVSKQSKPAPKGRGRKKNTVDDDDDFEVQENGHSSNDVVNKDTVLLHCKLVMDDLCYCLTKFSLLIDEGSLNQTIQTMVQVAGTEKKESSLDSLPRNRPSTAYLAHKAYRVLETLCTPFHGTVSGTLKDVMRYLLTPICIYDQNSWNHNSHEAVVVKDHSINFIIKLLNTLKEEAYDAVYTLTQHICLKVPDKADIRSKYVDIIISFVGRFPVDLYYKAVLFMCSLCVSAAIKHRLAGVEIVIKLALMDPIEEMLNKSGHTIVVPARSSIVNSLSSRLTISSEKSNADNNSEEQSVSIPNTVAVTHRFYFALIVSRCGDVSPRVRMKSLSGLSSILRATGQHINFLVEEALTYPNLEVQEMYDFNKVFLNKPEDGDGFGDPLPTAGTIYKLVERLSQDAKALVRKNALHVIADLCMLSESWVTKERLNILVRACKDTSMGNRKLMAQCLTDILESSPQSELVLNSWVAGVVPLFSENEIKAQEKVLELASSVIIDNLVAIDRMTKPEHHLPWKIIATISRMDMRKLFKYACQQWCTKNFIKDGLIKNLQTHLTSENKLPAWYFLGCIAEFKELPNPELVLQYFYDKVYQQNGIDELESQLVMNTLVLCWHNLKRDQITELCEKLKYSLDNYEIPLSLINGSLDIVHLNEKDTIKEWAEHLIMDCQEKTKKRGKKIVEEECYSDSQLCRLIFMIGNLSLIVPDMVDLETVSMLANLVDLANIDEERLDVSLSHFGSVQAVAVTTLGKLCLQNQFTAKAVVPILGALVSAKTPSGIKNNANIALTDLCIRFSSLVEPYFGDMFVCLKDSDAVVRRNTLQLIAMLIQEQYLKLKAHIFVYLITMLLDPVEEIRDFTSSFIVNSLLTNDSNIVQSFFVPAVFFLNGHEIGSRDYISNQEKEVFSMMGAENTSVRRDLYIFLLQQMDDVLKFKTRYRICVDILAQIADDKIALKGPKGYQEKGVLILKDSLFILACEEIRMTVRKNCKDGAADEDEDDMNDAVAAAKKSVMNQLYTSLSKKNLVDNIMPVFIRLRRKLDSEKSPLITDVILCLGEILKEFTKEQMDEILSVDPNLAAEVQHALRRQESEEGVSNQLQEEGSSSPGDVIMEQMAQVANRLSCRVILHGPESISADGSKEDESKDLDEELLNGVRPVESSQNYDATPLKVPRVSKGQRHSLQVNGKSPPMNGDTEQTKGRAKRSGRSDRSSSVISDRSDSNSPSISSLSEQTKAQAKRSGRSDRSSSIMSDRSDRSPSISSLSEQSKAQAKRSGRSDRSSSVMSDNSDCSPSLSSLSSQASSSSNSSKSRRRKR